MTLFSAALAARGFPPPVVISWLDYLRDPKVLEWVPLDDCWFRIDSAGESFEVERALLKLGAAAAKAARVDHLSPAAVARLVEDRGRILCPRQHHLGFQRVLRRLGRQLTRRPGWRVLNPPKEIDELFDKRRTSARYAKHGIPVPESLGAVRSVAELHQKMEATGAESVFVKLSCGSSASCLGFYRRANGRAALHTTIEEAEAGRYNNLQLQHLAEPRRIRALLTWLLREGAQVERAIPKARLGGAFFDCRVLCVAGEPSFVVVRQNRHPITNLHLGGSRGDLAALRAAVPPAQWEAAMVSCRQVAALYRGLHLGIDLMFEADLQGHRILEANAFGDLLPNLTHQGFDVWEWEVAALQRWEARSHVWCPA